MHLCMYCNLKFLCVMSQTQGAKIKVKIILGFVFPDVGGQFLDLLSEKLPKVCTF